MDLATRSSILGRQYRIQAEAQSHLALQKSVRLPVRTYGLRISGPTSKQALETEGRAQHTDKQCEVGLKSHMTMTRTSVVRLSPHSQQLKPSNDMARVWRNAERAVVAGQELDCAEFAKDELMPLRKR
jgi:hypothetical protein